MAFGCFKCIWLFQILIDLGGLGLIRWCFFSAAAKEFHVICVNFQHVSWMLRPGWYFFHPFFIHPFLQHLAVHSPPVRPSIRPSIHSPSIHPSSSIQFHPVPWCMCWGGKWHDHYRWNLVPSHRSFTTGLLAHGRFSQVPPHKFIPISMSKLWGVTQVPFSR